MERVKVKIGSITFDQTIGLTILSPRRRLDRNGKFTNTIPESVETSADDLAQALAAV
jgi:hypothetical protein